MSWAEAWSIHFIDPHLSTVLSLTVVLLLVHALQSLLAYLYKLLTSYEGSWIKPPTFWMHFSGHNYLFCTPCGGSPDAL